MSERDDHVWPTWLDVSRETFDRLVAFDSMVRHWTTRINLVSPNSIGQLWHRHILDSAQLATLDAEGEVWADLGSGGGFPGIVVAVMSLETSPQRWIHLVESDQRKAAFLRKAATELGLRVQVHAARSESIPPIGAHVVSARALAPLETLLQHVERHISPGGRAILPKGARTDEEIAAARRIWAFDATIHPSLTDPAGKIVLIENLRHG